MAEPRLVIFIQETVVAQDGQYIPCIAVEGEKGYYKTEWRWGKDIDQARRLVDERNGRAGIGEEEAIRIILGTIFHRGTMVVKG